MTKKEYVNKQQELDKLINNLELEKINLKIKYTMQHVKKYEHGDILKLTLWTGETIQGAFYGYAKYSTIFQIDDETGDARPYLHKVTSHGGLTKERVEYDTKSRIKKIEVVGKCATCGDCAFKKYFEGETICTREILTDDEGNSDAIIVSDNKTACPNIEFVIWENHVAHLARYDKQGNHTKRGYTFLRTDTWKRDEEGCIVEMDITGIKEDEPCHS